MRELLQQALIEVKKLQTETALRRCGSFLFDRSIAALEAALAQPAQTTTTREAFENWLGTTRFSRTTLNEWDIALLAWQAATAHEREACAKLCLVEADYRLDRDIEPLPEDVPHVQKQKAFTAYKLAEDIRARSNDE